MSMRNKIIIGCMLLGALSVGAQEKPVTAADYKQKVLEYSRQIKQSAEERIAMQHAIKAAKTAFFPAVDFSGSYQYRISTIWISAPAWLSKWIITPIVWELP